MTKPIVLWSTDFAEITGQAAVTRRVAALNQEWIIAVFPSGSSAKALYGIRAVLRVWATTLGRRSDTIYAVCSRSTLGFVRDIPALIWSRLGIRIVTHTHGSDLPLLFRRNLVGPLARFMYRKCEIVVPSPHLVEELAPHCRKVHLCENFTMNIDRAVREVNATDGVVLLWNSNLMASKGVVDLVAACRHIASETPNFKLILLGRPVSDEEASSEEMESWCKEISSLDWIDVVGPVEPNLVAAFVARADAIALPSRYTSECQPLAIIDAMCAGKPILVADTPALRATVGDYPAFFCSPDEAGIFNALPGLLNDPPSSNDIRAAALRAQDRFSPERFDQKMETILGGEMQ